MTHAIRPVDFDNLKTMTYEVTDRVARITFNRPEKGNAIVADTPLELSALVERADLDPNVHVILVSGRGEGFCAGFDLSAYAEGSSSAGGGSPYKDTVLSGKTQAINHLPDQPWDPMIDYQMMSRFVRGFSSLMHADKPTVVKIHGYCVAGGTDIALHADQVIAAADAKIGYPPTRVWGVPAAGMWAHRLGDQRAKRLLLTGDCITGAQAAEWGLAVEAPDPDDLDERTERLVERIAAVPVNQLIMVKLAMNTALLQPGRRHQPDGQHGVRRRRPAHPGGPRVRRARRGSTASARRSASATSRSATTAARRPGCSRSCPRSAARVADDGPLGRAERAARRAPGVGHRERTHQAHSRFRHQGADAAGGADPDGRARVTWCAPTTATGSPTGCWPGSAARTTRINPQAAEVGRHLDHAGDHQCRHRRPHPRGVANHAAGQAVRRTSRGGVAAARQPDVELTAEVLDRVRVLHARDDDPAGLAARLWDLPGWARIGRELLDEMATAADVPGRFVAAAGMVRHLLTDPVLPDRTAARRLAGRRACGRPTRTSPRNWSRGATMSN